MSRTLKTYKLPPLTVKQIDEISNRTGDSYTTTIIRAVDRLHQQEINMDRKQQAAKMLDSFDFETIVNYMDDGVREQVHAELAPTTEAEFLQRYMELHKAKFGQDFIVM